jgi:hypothetical protein
MGNKWFGTTKSITKFEGVRWRSYTFVRGNIPN